MARRLRLGPLALVAGLLSGVCAGVPGAQAAEAPYVDMTAAIETVQRYDDALLAFTEGVIGAGAGIGEDGSPVIRVYVESLPAIGVPSTLDGLPVELAVTGRVVPRGAQEERPVPIGVSIGHPAVTAGTLGARVKSGSTVYILNNNHVIANENDASIGDAVLQPGPVDGGTAPGDQIGTLSAFVSIVFSDSASNTMDAAIAVTSTANVSTGTPAGGYGVPSSSTTGASVGQSVQKYGRTTGQTTGTVSEVGATVTSSATEHTRSLFQPSRPTR